MAHLSLVMLGSFQATLDGEPIAGLMANKVRALLAYLAIEAHRNAQEHPRAVLAGLLWPDRPERVALTNLRTALARLRSAIGDRDATPPFLQITRETIQFDPASDHWLDVAAFQALIETTAADQPAVQQLEEAVALYRGELLTGFSVRGSPEFEDWALHLRQRLHWQALEALSTLSAYYERRGAYSEAIACARRQVALEPWQEDGHRRWMRALALSGHRGRALAQYEACRQVLADELGVEPETATTALYEQIRDGELPTAVGVPQLGALQHLPAPLAPLVGREGELADIASRLHDPGCRLLTLVGPGGSGKTHLALEAAASQVAAFAHGVYFCPLAPLRSADAIVQTVAQAVGLSLFQGGDPHQQLLVYLRDKHLLLLLDNYEHLLSSPGSGPEQQRGAGMVVDILYAAPKVKVVVTSRARLNVPAEHLFPVGGLAYPDRTSDVSETPDVLARYSAVALFVQSARRVLPGFALSENNVTDLVRICRLTHGMPLGILLAAAWVPMLDPAEIADQIEQSIDLLETSWRGVPERQRSMRAVFDHSWRLLSKREQEVLQALSVVRGGCTRQAARAVTDASLHELMALVNRSLLQRVEGTGHRYELHELLRQYAAEKLEAAGKADGVREAHCAYYTAALRGWEADYRSSRQQEALVASQADVENARAAWDWAVEHRLVARLDETAEGMRLLVLHPHCGMQTGAAMFRDAASALAGARTGEERRVLGKLVAIQGHYESMVGSTERATQLLERSQVLLTDAESDGQDVREERAFVLLNLGRILTARDPARARRPLEQSVALYRALDDRLQVGYALWFLSIAANRLGEYGEAKSWCEEALSVWRALDHQQGIAVALLWSSEIAAQLGQLELADRLSGQGVNILEQMAGQIHRHTGLRIRGTALCWLGRFVEAQEVLERGLESARIKADQWYVVEMNNALVIIDLGLGKYRLARITTRETLELAREGGSPHQIGRTLLNLGWVGLAEAEAQLDAGAASSAQDTYAEASRVLQECVAIYQQGGQRSEHSWALACLAYAARRLGQTLRVRQCLCQALRTAADIRAVVPVMYALPAAALLFADRGQVERAVELYALASLFAHVAQSHWFEDVAGRHITAEDLSPDAIDAARERGRARDLWATVEALLAELES